MTKWEKICIIKQMELGLDDYDKWEWDMIMVAKRNAKKDKMLLSEELELIAEAYLREVK